MDLAIDKFDKRRFGKVTGSKCSVLFPKKSAEVGQDTYARQLATQMYFETYDETSTWQAEHGNFSENTASEHYGRFYTDDSSRRGVFVEIGECAGTCDELFESYGVDYKCPTSLEGWIDYLYDGINSQQYHQAQMYMYLFGVDKWKVCIYLTETQRMSDFGLIYPVQEKDRMIIIEVEKEIGWAEKLEVAVPKIVAKRTEYFDKLVERFGVKSLPNEQLKIQ
jgi:hypothetical protein